MALSQQFRLLDEIKSRFAQFNELNRPGKGKRYPVELKDLVRQAALDGVVINDLLRVTGVSALSLARWLEHSSLPTVRRLEVIDQADSPGASRFVHFPSGVIIEFGGAVSTASLVEVVCRYEACHAAHC